MPGSPPFISLFLVFAFVVLLLFFFLLFALVFFALIVFWFLLNREQFDLEDQGRVRPNVGARAPVRVSKIRRNKELPFRSDGHELERFRPPFNDLTDAKGRRLSALVGAVKLRAIDQSAAVITNDGVGRRGLRARASSQDLVLQAVGQSNDA